MFKVGQKLILVDMSNCPVDHLTVGKTYVVKEVDSAGDVRVINDKGEKSTITFAWRYKPAEEDNGLQFKVGDKAIFVKGREYLEGTIVEIVSVDEEDVVYPYMVESVDGDQDRDWVCASQLSPVNTVEHLSVPDSKVDSNPVTKPSHYTRGKIEVINFITDQKMNFLEGNVIKYVCRYKDKNGLEDLKKAQQYLTWLINTVEGKELQKG